MLSQRNLGVHNGFRINTFYLRVPDLPPFDQHHAAVMRLRMYAMRGFVKGLRVTVTEFALGRIASAM